MKILLGHKFFFRGGGTSTYLFALMDYLRAHGHEPIPFSVLYDKNEPSEYSRYFLGAPADAATSHLRDMKLTPLKVLRLLGRATYSFEARRKLRVLIADTGPEIAYLHNLYNYMSPSPIDECKARGLPVVMRVPDFNLVCAELHLLREGKVCKECVGHSPLHALKYRCLKGSLGVTAARAVSMTIHNWLGIYRKVDLFVTPSAVMREVLIEGGYDGARIVHLPSFYAGHRDEASEQSEGDYVLYFGRISTEKGLDTLLRAFGLAAEASFGRKVRLLLAGADVDGLTGRLQALAQELGLGERVQFLGPLGRRELDELIAHCLFTVIPSRWYDNSPMSVFESFAHGKPVVGSNIGGIPEQITPDCGLLCEPGNVEELAEAMSKLIANADLRAGMGAAARRRLREAFSPETHCRRLLDIFEALINGSDPTAPTAVRGPG